MPTQNLNPQIDSDEIVDIIRAVPKWILRWGITLIFTILIVIGIISALIQYPDIVKTNLKINSLNAPKPVLTRQNGKITKLLVSDGQKVFKGQDLAFLESTANPKDVLAISKEARTVQSIMLNKPGEIIRMSKGLNLGELQSAYQNFYQQYLVYLSTEKNGYYSKRMFFLKRDIKDIDSLRRQIIAQKETRYSELNNMEQEYKAYKKLFKNKVISRSEFIQQENKYLAGKYPLQQIESDLTKNTSSYIAKEKEILDLQHTVDEEQSKFFQSLSQFITECDDWILLHILRSPIDGRVSFAGIIQENQNVILNQEVFIVSSSSTDFFGEVEIPQYNMGKIKSGQDALVKLHSYPFEQYGIIRGKLVYVSDVALKDSVFVGRINFKKSSVKSNISLKNGMHADAEIITEESSLLQRFFRNITKMLNNS